MAGISYKIDDAQLRRELQSPGGLVWNEMLRRGNRVLNQARRNAPVDEGRLRASLSLQMRQEISGPTAVVGSNLEYSVFVHEGTGIYAGRGMIRPRSSRFLSWPVKNNSGRGNRRYRGGRTQSRAFAKAVRGVPPRPFLRDALSAAR